MVYRMKPVIFSDLNEQCIQNQFKIETWLAATWSGCEANFTTSVDIRYSGYKWGVIDTNLFPAGFNNLNTQSQEKANAIIKKNIHDQYPACRRMILIPENHTRNQYYFESLAVLKRVLENKTVEVRVGAYGIDHFQEIVLQSGEKLLVEKLVREKNRIMLAGYEPDVIILNNDLSEGVPAILKHITQPIMPALQWGWAFRSKAEHFTWYEYFCKELSALINIDYWQCAPLYAVFDRDTVAKDERDELSRIMDKVLDAVRSKYQEYNISDEPFVVLKPDAGTYGMGVKMFHSAEMLKALTQKQYDNLFLRKGGGKGNRVLIQEGIPSIERVGQDAAERVICLVGKDVVGGFYRSHALRTSKEILSGTGVAFQAFEENTLSYAANVLARVAVLAAAHEKTNMPDD